MIEDYIILSDWPSRNLEQSVRQHLRDGWELQGGIATHIERRQVVITQAMVKRAKGSELEEWAKLTEALRHLESKTLQELVRNG